LSPRARADFFTQMPVTDDEVRAASLLTDPLPHDVTVAGPTRDAPRGDRSDDTNWIIVLKDVGRTFRFDGA